MKNPPGYRLTWFVVIPLLCLSFLIKWAGPILILQMFDGGNFALLNQWLNGEGQMSLGFYLGQSESLFWGPFAMLFSGIAFVIFAYAFLQESTYWIFAFAVFIFLALTKWDILFFPPYGDAIGGPFAEAIWLFEHNFDYVALSREQGYIWGGPKVYLFSIYPTFLALAMKMIPNTNVFLAINHIIVFGLGALSISIFRQLLLKAFSKPLSLLAALIFLMLPLFQSQVEAINMEIPMLVFVLFSVYYLAEKNILLAGLMAIVATMIKGVAIYLCGAVFFVSLYLIFSDWAQKGKLKLLIYGLLPVCFVGLKSFASMFILYDQGSVDMLGPLLGWYRIKALFESYYFLLAFCFFVGFICLSRRKETLKTFPRIFENLKTHYVALVVFVATAGWFVLFVNSYAVIPRYKLILTPLNLFCIVFMFSHLIKSEKLLRKVAMSLIVLALYSSYGALLPARDDKDDINGHITRERSLEYRNELKLRVQLAKVIEEDYQGYTVGAPFLMAQALAMPKLGYVKSRRKVIVYGNPCHYGGISFFKGLDQLDLNNTVWIGVKSRIPQKLKMDMAYPLDPQDLVLKTMQIGKREATLFKGGIAIERMRIVGLEVMKALARTGKLTGPQLIDYK